MKVVDLNRWQTDNPGQDWQEEGWSLETEARGDRIVQVLVRSEQPEGYRTRRAQRKKGVVMTDTVDDGTYHRNDGQMQQILEAHSSALNANAASFHLATASTPTLQVQMPTTPSLPAPPQLPALPAPPTRKVAAAQNEPARPSASRKRALEGVKVAQPPVKKAKTAKNEATVKRDTQRMLELVKDEAKVAQELAGGLEPRAEPAPQRWRTLRFWQAVRAGRARLAESVGEAPPTALVQAAYLPPFIGDIERSHHPSAVGGIVFCRRCVGTLGRWPTPSARR